MSTVRVILVLLLVLLLVGLIGFGRWRGGHRADPAADGRDSLLDEDCRRCHEAIWNEWKESFHSRAFSDPNVQAAFAHFGFDRNCQSCHAPKPVLATGPGKPVELRPREQYRGVSCLSCHGTPDGRSVAARHTIADAPCRPVARPELAESAFCGTCHDAIYTDWQESRYHAEGKTCQACHMPADEERKGRHVHLCFGGHHAATVRGGVRMSCRQAGDVLVVSVANHATGHNFPGERHHRVLLVQVIQRDGTGKVVLSRQVTIKGVTPFRGESSADKIRAGETFDAEFPVVNPPVVAEVKLLCKQFPWLSPWDALVVHQAELRLEQP